MMKSVSEVYVPLKKNTKHLIHTTFEFKCHPLMDKNESYISIPDIKRVLKSAVSGLIKFHEDRIEELIEEWASIDYFYERFGGEGDLHYQELIYIQYESIMAIEHWLEDVVK